MNVQLPVGVTSITLAVTGVKVPNGAGVIAGVDEVEGTQLCASYNRPKVSDTTNMSTGTVNMILPACITSITINAATYAVTAGAAPNVAAVNANTLFNQAWINAFRVVGG